MKQRQVLWALRRGLTLFRSNGDSLGQVYDRAYTDLSSNLFRPLSARARACYEQGDGNELGNGRTPGKLQAVHSSAAIATNVFDLWLEASDLTCLCKAFGISATGGGSVELEAKFPIGSAHRRAPNLDVVIRHPPEATHQVTAIECKFTEAYSNRAHGGLKQTYLDDASLWTRYPHLHALAKEISPEDQGYPHLHPAQLIKHLLGLTAACGHQKFRLIYLWYDVPTVGGDRHRDELERFAKIAQADGVAFQSMTWQELILRLAKVCRQDHEAYVDYLVERYV